MTNTSDKILGKRGNMTYFIRKKRRKGYKSRRGDDKWANEPT